MNAHSQPKTAASTLHALTGLQLTGIYNVRNELLDYCSNQERINNIATDIYHSCEAVEKKHTETTGVKCCVSEFELRYHTLDNGLDVMDVHFMTKRGGDSLGHHRLYYRDESLSSQTLEEEQNTETIPSPEASKKRGQYKNISPNRMKRMIENSKPMMLPSAAGLAMDVIDAFMKASLNGAGISFSLDIHKSFVTMHTSMGDQRLFRMTLPMTWFKKPDKVAQDHGDHDYLFAPLDC